MADFEYTEFTICFCRYVSKPVFEIEKFQFSIFRFTRAEIGREKFLNCQKANRQGRQKQHLIFLNRINYINVGI